MTRGYATKSALAGTVLCAVAGHSIAGGGPGFEPAITLSTAQRPAGAAIGDYNNDGIPDIAVTVDDPDRILILLGGGDGAFSPGTPIFTGGGSGPDTVQAGDIDGDGDDDLAVVLNNTETLAIYTNNGGIFTQTATAALGSEPRRLQAEDIDADGDLDFATANRDSNDLSVVLNNAGVFTTVSVPVGSEPRGVAAGDLDGDGDADLVAARRDSRDLAVFTNNAGVFSQTATLSVGGNVRPDGVQIVDLDADGQADIFAATSGDGLNRVTIFFGTGAGFTGPAFVPLPGQDSDTVRAADFDLDGDPDLVATNDDSTVVAVVENLGARTFGPPSTLTTGLNPQTIAIGDADGNGSPDMAVPNRDANTTTVFLSTVSGGEDCPADLTGPGGDGVPDGSLTADDFFFYLGLFAAGDPQADLTGPGGDGVPDGSLTADDFFFYLGLFAAGCP